MNKLTGWRHFVRIRTILRRSRKAVKRRAARKMPMPVKSAGAVHKPGKTTPVERRALARLYANGILRS
jgi:hypothetical protein